MTARFRLVQYTPDPFAGTRVTVGALVEAGGRVEFVRARSLPGPSGVGSRTAWVTMQLILDSFVSPNTFDTRPGEASPLAGLTEPRPVPAGVDNPAAWVEAFILPQPGRTERDTKEVVYRQNRDQLGLRFFKQWDVDRYVRRKFRPESLPVLKARGLPQVKHDISHFVSGASELLLMEPIIGTRARLANDLKGISESFLAYRALFEMAKTSRRPTFIVYVLTSGYTEALAEAHDILQGAAQYVVDVDDPAQRLPLLQHIKAVGHSGGNPGAFPMH